MSRERRATRHGRFGARAAALLLPFAVACASSGAPREPEEPAYGAATSEAAVRAFLDGARAKDYRAMAAHFGTTMGPAEKRFGVAEVEQRMIFLAALLRHDSYQLRVANLAQLGPERVRYVAVLVGTRRGTVELPVVTVPASDGRWYVEQLEVDALGATPAG